MPGGKKKILLQIGRNIKSARVRLGYSQKAIEDLSDLSYRHFQDIEAGKVNVKIETLIEIANCFKVTLSDLVKMD